MKSIRSSIISLVHVTVFFLHFGVSSFPAIFVQVNSVVVIIYIHKLMLGIHDTSFASKSPFKFLEFKFLIVYTIQETWIKKLEQKDLDGIATFNNISVTCISWQFKHFKINMCLIKPTFLVLFCIQRVNF
jgi:hypothetical protein